MIKPKLWLGSSIVKDSFWITVSDAATKGIGGLLALAMARFLGPHEYGKYAVYLSIVTIVFTITVLGFEQHYLRRAAIDTINRKRYFQIVIRQILITGIAAIAMVSAFVMSTNNSREAVFLTLVLAVYSFAGRFHLAFRYYCLVNRKLKMTAIIQSVSSVSLFLVVLGALAYERGVFAIATLQATVITLTTLLWFAKVSDASITPRIPLKEIGQFAKESVSFAFSNIIWILYFNADTYIVSALQSVSDAGMYAGVFKIFSLSYIFGFAYVSAFVPRLFKQYSVDRETYRVTAAKCLLSTAALSFPVFLALFTLADWYIPITVGREYLGPGLIIAQTLAFAAILRFVNFGLSEVLTSSGRQPARVALESIMLVSNIGLNILLIPRYGAQGAALATVFAEVMFFVFCVVVFRSHTKTLVRSMGQIFQRGKTNRSQAE